jgi:hypothetical protein
MITLKAFLGAFLEQVTLARAMSDSASVRVAEQYLNHNFLKGFPVPRMHIQDIQLELNFAVAPKAGAFEDEETQKNIRLKIQQFVATLPDQDQFKQYFVKNPRLREAWNNQLDGLDQRVERALARYQSNQADQADQALLAYALSLVIENYIREVILSQGGDQGVSLIGELFDDGRSQGGRQGASDVIEDNIKQILGAIDVVEQKSEQKSDSLTSLFDLKVMVEASELEQIDPSHLHKVKFTFSSSDRKWVVNEKNGEKTYLLDRH